MKTFPAIVAAVVITVIVGISMLLIGGNALFNPNAGPVSNSPAQAQAASGSASNATAVSAAVGQSQLDQQQIAQLQAQVKQYQAREQQYQTELNQAAQKINQDNAQLNQATQAVQNYQQILAQLQQIGLISVSNNGQITVNGFGGGSRSGGNSFFGDDR